jgi:uncharacterized protein (TIGR02996 family)
MTDEEFGFIQAVVKDPDNDTPRLLYADWLDEQGDPAASARAEFIRIQCQLARDHTRHPLLDQHRQRERELLRAYQARWVAEVAHTNLVSTCRFHRGFLTGIGLPAHQFFTLAPRLFRLAPIQQLTVHELTEVGVASLAYTPECSRLNCADTRRQPHHQRRGPSLGQFSVSACAPRAFALRQPDHRSGHAGGPAATATVAGVAIGQQPD